MLLKKMVHYGVGVHQSIHRNKLVKILIGHLFPADKEVHLQLNQTKHSGMEEMAKNFQFKPVLT
ncbi:MAG: hypothetical protein RO257_10560 [Candidatus Kapabacteria bacterium]|jgi:hypothetical protein|nr:hypothetical protein [Candidatus Kapabacteria bacterium]